MFESDNILKPPKKMTKYLVVGGSVISKTDGQRHYVNARQLAQLYGVDVRECLLVENRDVLTSYRRPGRSSLIVLTPRCDGNYSLENLRQPTVQESMIINRIESQCRFYKTKIVVPPHIYKLVTEVLGTKWAEKYLIKDGPVPTK